MFLFEGAVIRQPRTEMIDSFLYLFLRKPLSDETVTTKQSAVKMSSSEEVIPRELNPAEQPSAISPEITMSISKR